MALRSRRREFDRTEAVVKLVLLVIVGLALLAGGITGFANALAGIVFLLLLLAAVGFSAFLILKSRLFPRKKLGLLLIIAALLMTWYWNSTRAPRPWVEEQLRVVSMKGPLAVTETVYNYHPDESVRGVFLQAVQTKLWDKLAQARNYQPTVTGIYYNPANPSEARFEPVNRWHRTQATPVSTKITVTGEGIASVQIGSVLFPRTGTLTGPQVRDWTNGMRVSIWLNPDDPDQISYEPRLSPSPPKYWLVVLAGMMGLGGIVALSLGKEWIDPSKPQPSSRAQFAAAFGQPPVIQPSIREQLRAIDWFQFEAITARILEADGWTVQRSGGANPDGGADLLAVRNGRKAVVQCKHWRNWEVKPSTLRELLGTRSSAQFAADDAILFTLSDCTEASLTFARENNVAIYDSGMIEAAISRLGIARFPELTHPDDKRCPKCGAAMILRENVAKPFWGCSTYPRCRGTIERA